MSAAQTSLFAGVELVNASGKRALGDVVVGDGVLALYFSAEWCPYCRTLQPELNAFYDAVNAENRQLEIVFVSSDNSETDQLAYLKSKHGPWWAVPFDNEFRDDLKRKYLVCANKEREQVGIDERISGLPTLLILKSDGEIIDRDGVKAIQDHGVRALEQWRAAAQ